MMGETRLVAERARTGEPVRDTLRANISHLTEAVCRHNFREEQLLRDIIPAVDAWGAARASIMVEEHVQEHDQLCAALLGIPCTPDEFAGAGVSALLDLMLEHMDREEATFLGDDVLRDDAVVANQFAG
jgi:hypothetical protein